MGARGGRNEKDPMRGGMAETGRDRYPRQKTLFTGMQSISLCAAAGSFYHIHLAPGEEKITFQALGNDAFCLPLDTQAHGYDIVHW